MHDRIAVSDIDVELVEGVAAEVLEALLNLTATSCRVRSPSSLTR
jgi:hypothetical protein